METPESLSLLSNWYSLINLPLRIQVVLIKMMLTITGLYTEAILIQITRVFSAFVWNLYLIHSDFRQVGLE
jgi:hypothetical protein